MLNLFSFNSIFWAAESPIQIFRKCGIPHGCYAFQLCAKMTAAASKNVLLHVRWTIMMILSQCPVELS